MNKMLIKGWFFLIFMGCSFEHQLSSESTNWCFVKFLDRSKLLEYIEVHETQASQEGSVDSMRLLGCAYYQAGDIKSAEKWLKTAYKEGHSSVPIDLAAIYLKEGDLARASIWQRENTLEDTARIRWLRVVENIEQYNKTGASTYLKYTQSALQDKIRYEGQTPMTQEMLQIIETLIEEENACRMKNPECSHVYMNEKKAYMKTFSKGVLALLIPSTPQSWKYDADETGILPEKKSESSS